jgi:hypothetical protein
VYYKNKSNLKTPKSQGEDQLVGPAACLRVNDPRSWRADGMKIGRGKQKHSKKNVPQFY